MRSQTLEPLLPALGSDREDQTLKTRYTIGVLIAASLLTVAGTGLAANEAQSGSGTTCVDYNVLFLIGGVSIAGETGNVVDVAPGTGFEVSSDTQDTVYVDFYDESGGWSSYNEGNTTGTVPAGAAFGTVCVAVMDFYPSAPNPTSTWTYQDGF